MTRARPRGLWAGAGGGPAPELDHLNRSLPFDWRLWPHEIAVDGVWVRELADLGLLTRADEERLRDGLEAVRARLAIGRPAEEPDEDIHSLIERWLEDEVGPLASQVRLGRSRNDVVSTDTRMWARDACAAMGSRVLALQAALVRAAERAGDVAFPAYTHLQRAQPTRASAWLLSHFWPLERDRARIADASRRLNRLPLGAAAGAGSGLPVDRARLAESLGFDGPEPNALDAVGARDWAAEVLWTWTMTAVDLSRLGEDLVVFASAEFGLVRLGDAWTTGSSLMPQKRNPDGAELARAGGGALVGLLTGLLATLKGLPSGYAKDLQEDKRALFEAEGRLTPALDALAGTVDSLAVRPDAARDAVDPSVLASDLAERMATAGTPFRDAHETVLRLVRRGSELGVPLPDLPSEEVTAVAPGLAGTWTELFDVEAALERRTASGGSSREAVAAQLAAAREALAAADDPAVRR
jgi:argininosuccinate lyase